MNTDELNVLCGIVGQYGHVKVGDEFDAGTTSIIAVPNDQSCLGTCGIYCVFNTPDAPCPKFSFGSTSLPSCVTSDNINIIFVPKLEYLTWKLTQS